MGNRGRDRSLTEGTPARNGERHPVGTFFQTKHGRACRVLLKGEKFPLLGSRPKSRKETIFAGERRHQGIRRGVDRS